MPDYSIVIPIHNNETTIALLLMRIDAVFQSLNKSYECICVDDGSVDDSWKCLKEQLDHYSLKLIRLEKNIGQHRATLVGFYYCRSNRIITLDGDLQHQPEDIPLLMKRLTKQVSVVIAAYHQRQASWWRQLGTTMVQWLLTLFYKKPRALEITSFKIYQGAVIEQLKKHVNDKGYLASWILENVKSEAIINQVVTHQNRSQKGSSYNLIKLIQLVVLIFIQAMVGSKKTTSYSVKETINC